MILDDYSKVDILDYMGLQKFLLLLRSEVYFDQFLL